MTHQLLASTHSTDIFRHIKNNTAHVVFHNNVFCAPLLHGLLFCTVNIFFVRECFQLIQYNVRQCLVVAIPFFGQLCSFSFFYCYYCYYYCIIFIWYGFSGSRAVQIIYNELKKSKKKHLQNILFLTFLIIFCSASVTLTSLCY